MRGLRAELEQRVQVAETLRRLVMTVNSGRALDEILTSVLAEAVQLLGCTAGVLYMADGEQDSPWLTTRASYGVALEEVPTRQRIGSPISGLAVSHRRAAACPDLLAGLEIPPDQRPVVVLEDTPNYIRCVKVVDEFDTPESLARIRHVAEHHGAILSVPLIVRDSVYGALTMFYPLPREFGGDEIRLTLAFADQAALAIENARLHEQAQQAAAQEERNRLARELHDAVTQTLFSASLIADVLPTLSEHQPEELAPRLEDLRRLTRGALAEMRTLLFELRPTALKETPLADLLRQLVEASMARDAVNNRLTVQGEARTIPTDVKVALYRLAQEALNNISKHARARNAEVRLVWAREHLCLEIADDGRGFDPAAIPPGHLGIGFMNERAAAISASLRIDTARDTGTTVTIRWPDGRC
ncbi:MAG: GAF domain-containing sensor histidine kinase [Chloroflexi bacterium]|nr:GAF domain-containing sensor histidine kinase [Chloroflexota bacterium]